MWTITVFFLQQNKNHNDGGGDNFSMIHDCCLVIMMVVEKNKMKTKKNSLSIQCLISLWLNITYEILMMMIMIMEKNFPIAKITQKQHQHRKKGWFKPEGWIIFLLSVSSKLHGGNFTPIIMMMINNILAFG